ncbi:hypothetical protein V5799_010370 [Amblyomma americanum]|uniref:Uncharacterized protein n=1 Tax=Amblyomma americanum TaxID=6943 RepID=A0AAQ4EK28_AMBAM
MEFLQQGVSPTWSFSSMEFINNFLNRKFLRKEDSATGTFYNMEFLQHGVASTRSFPTSNFSNREFLKLEFLQQGVPTTICSSIEFLQQGVSPTGISKQGAPTTEFLQPGGSSAWSSSTGSFCNMEFLQLGVFPTARFSRIKFL